MNVHVDPSTQELYLDHALDPVARAAVETHLAACADCRAEVDALGEEIAALDAVSQGCGQLSALTLTAFADGELPAEELPAVAAHVATCPTCQAEVGFARAFSRALRRLSTEPMPESFRFRMTPDMVARMNAVRGVLPGDATATAQPATPRPVVQPVDAPRAPSPAPRRPAAGRAPGGGRAGLRELWGLRTRPAPGWALPAVGLAAAVALLAMSVGAACLGYTSVGACMDEQLGGLGRPVAVSPADATATGAARIAMLGPARTPRPGEPYPPPITVAPTPVVEPTYAYPGPDYVWPVGGAGSEGWNDATATAEMATVFAEYGTFTPTPHPTYSLQTQAAVAASLRTQAAARNDLKLFPIVQVNEGLGTDVPTALPHTPQPTATPAPSQLTAAAASLASPTPTGTVAAGVGGAGGPGGPALLLAGGLLALALMVGLLAAFGLGWRLRGGGQDEQVRHHVSAVIWLTHTDMNGYSRPNPGAPLNGKGTCNNGS